MHRAWVETMSGATHTTCGNHRGPPSQRGREQYPTPRIAVTAFHAVETIAISVLNPCGTESDAISTVLTERGHHVVCNDIAHGGVDFLAMKESPRGVGCVVMNAPFSLSADFVAHALDLGIPKVCVLQRLGWAECGTSTTRRKPETERRRALFQRQQLERIWAFGTRLPERLTRRRLLRALQQGAVLVRSFDDGGTSWSLASGRGVAASAAMAALQAESMAQTYRWCGDDAE
jgi:hypothetical protein